MKQQILAGARRAVVAAIALTLAAAPAALAQPALAPTAISIGAPATATLGQRVTLQARLVDGSGAPLAKATVFFTSPLAFLNGSGDVVLAQATTDKDGLAVTEYEVRSTGQLTIQAEFRGNDAYGPSKAGATMTVTGDGQLYIQHAGLHVPGLNAGPARAPALVNGKLVLERVPGTSALWPTMSGWPLAAILLTVWSLYAFVVTLIFRVARADDTTTSAPASGRPDGGASSGAATGPLDLSPAGTRPEPQGGSS